MIQPVAADEATFRLRWLAVAGAVFAFGFLTVLAYYGRTMLTYDEPWYLDSVALLHAHGFSADFLKALPGPAGPLYSIVHYVFEPVTQLSPPLVRWVNPMLLLASIIAISAVNKSLASVDALATAALFFAIPMTWPCAGMALTEMPAVCAYALHLLAMWNCLRGGHHHFAWAALAGIALGIAVLGRQPLLIGVVPLAYLGLRWPDRRPDMFLVFAASMAFVLPVFATWGGLVPPKTAFVAGGASLPHLILAGGYAAVCSFLVCPGILIWRPRVLVGSLIAGILANMVFQVATWLPMNSLAVKLIPASMVQGVAIAAYGLVIGLAIWFFASCLFGLVKRRDETEFTYVVMSLMLQAVAAMAVKHQFSSRYLVTAVPLFALLALATKRPAPFTIARLSFGAAIGCVSLINYLRLGSVLAE